MMLVTFRLAYWRRGINPLTDPNPDHLLVTIYRITGIPTPEMIGNETHWVTGNFTAEQIRGSYWVRDNHEPVNIAFLVIGWFALSAGFHFFAVIMGLFERFWFIYWRCVHPHSLCFFKS